MRKYSYKKDKKSRKEKIGFFTAFSVCLIAVGLALWSTYSSIGGFENSNLEEPTYVAYYSPTKQVDRNMTGVIVTEEDITHSEEFTTAFTEEDEDNVTTSQPVEENTIPPYTGDSQSLQTMLQVSKTLDYPFETTKIIKEYSEEAQYNSTMGDYRVHSGVDFEATEGESVSAMCDGVVEDIYKDGMYGVTVKIVNGNFSVCYCGLREDFSCYIGQQISRGDVIGCVGEVPCESMDGPHLHIEVKVGEEAIDPLLIISGNE